jgi:hypothetical protein
MTLVDIAGKRHTLMGSIRGSSTMLALPRTSEFSPSLTIVHHFRPVESGCGFT